jgi:hypothetical protein
MRTGSNRADAGSRSPRRRLQRHLDANLSEENGQILRRESGEVLEGRACLAVLIVVL